MSPDAKLHEALVQEGLYTKSLEEFQQQFASEESQVMLHQALSDEGLYTKDADSFKNQFFPPAQQNLAAMFQPQGTDESNETTSSPTGFVNSLGQPVSAPDVEPPPIPEESSAEEPEPSLADVFSNPPVQEDVQEDVPPMIAQIIGRNNDSPSPAKPSPEDDMDSLIGSFMEPNRAESVGNQEAQINNVRNYLSEERAGAEDLFINDEGEKFKEILGNLLGDDFDSYDGLTRAIVKGNIGDKRIVKLATGKKQMSKDFEASDLIPYPRAYTMPSEPSFKEMVEVHLSELPSILNGDDDRFTPRQIGILRRKIGPLLDETMKRGAMSHHTHGDGTFPLGATRMFSPQNQ